MPAILCKLVGGVSLCLVYTFYYTIGGDVSNYFLSARTFVNVLLDLNFELFWTMLNFFTNNIQQSGVYDQDYGPICFNHADYYALFTVCLSIPFCLIGCKSFIASTLLLGYVSFLGLWKLFEVFVSQFPSLQKQFAIAIFFVPSVFFWGSSLLKDTYTLSAVGFLTYGVYNFLILKQRKVKYLAILVCSSLVLIFIKPYIFFAMMPGSLIWVFFDKFARIKNPIIKTFALPALILIMASFIVLSMQFLGEYLGEYSLDNVLNKAVKTQQDLVRGEQYGSNYYNIGEFDASFSGLVSKIPAALNMALFRPYVWDARNPVMLLSGLENLFVLVFTIFIVLRVRFSTLIKSLFSHPLLIFSFLFALFFAFSVGLTTANYGALVRLKIPGIPFYLASLFILFHLNNLSVWRRSPRTQVQPA
ncbi:MAG TPA: hypothetical protein PLQ93_05060 [Bacteroidia bacterium]|nr:hypothetical protein [Bacteroidia bacterium]